MSPEIKIQREKIVIDASNSVLGRVASYAAKQSLLGKEVAIVNCNEALVTGNVRTSINEYNSARRRGGSSLNGPFFPKHPDKLVKRTVRGMLSYTQQRGTDALKRVMCYNNIPQEFQNSKKISLSRELRAKTIKLVDLSKEI